MSSTHLVNMHLHIADTLSRAYPKDVTTDQEDLQEDIEVMVHSFVKSLPISEAKLVELKRATREDKTLSQVTEFIQNGWPEHKQHIPPDVLPYWKVRQDVNEADGILLKGNQIIIPASMRQEILQLIHASHLGQEKSKSRARAVLYWPGMSGDIETLISKCTTCLEHRANNQKEPMIPHPIPTRPWQRVASDILEYQGKNYIIVDDYYSKYIEYAQIRDKTATTVIAFLKPTFARHGIPEEFVADNMPYNSYEFRCFAESWGFKLITSSPRYPQSNGLSERAVQTVKNILKKAEDPYIALMEYRNTPVTGMSYSPSQLLMSRVTRTKIPTTEDLLKPRAPEDVHTQLKRCQERQTKYYNRSTKSLRPLLPNEGIRIRQGKLWKPAKVLGTAQTPRSYIVQTPDGQQYRRNRRHLFKSNEVPPELTGSPDFDEDTSPTATTSRDCNTDTRNTRVSGRTRVPPTRFHDYVMY